MLSANVFRAIPLLVAAASLSAQIPPAGPPLNEGRGVTDGASYLAGPLRRGEQGTVVIGFAVAPDGRVVDCAVERSSGFAELDNWTCALYVHRARFTPAPAGDGRDRRSLSVRWQLPR